MRLSQYIGKLKEILDEHGNWKSLHNVPNDVLIRMAQRFQPHKRS